jgi:hypothetical protein
MVEQPMQAWALLALLLGQRKPQTVEDRCQWVQAALPLVLLKVRMACRMERFRYLQRQRPWRRF